MRSRNSVVQRWAIAAVAACCLGGAIRNAHSQSEDGAPTEAEIASAIEVLKADPNLSQERKTRTLRWAGKDEPRKTSSFARWVMNFFVWLGQLSRVLMWVIGALLALGLLAFLFRLFRNIEARDLRRAEAVPTHVRDLDIRPESLPDDIGAAALDLWQRGEHRSALALLYRGLLSRLAHVHAVPIRDSTTEGDCLALAAKHLQGERKDYVARLIGIWQRATYGGRDAQTDEVRALCEGFAGALAPVANSGQDV